MKKKLWLFGCLVLFLGLVFIQPVMAGNSSKETSWGMIKALYQGEESKKGSPESAPYWGNYIVSEAFYALSRSRSGGSSRSYNYGGWWAMGDWPYPWQGDCCNALGRVTQHTYGGCTSCRGSLGTWNGYQQGGECKFFVNLVLYRSSYGCPGGHLVLPKYYTYNNPRPWSSAQAGWIIQSASLPHTAIVVANLGWGLDVIDSNWIGGRGSFAIGRHVISASTLNAYDFKAYQAHEACVQIS